MSSAADCEEPDAKRPRLNDEEYAALRSKLKAKKKALQELPLFRLVDSGLSASLGLAKESRIPILASDVLTLINYSIAGDTTSYYPFRWCRLGKWNSLTHTVVVLIDGVSVDDYESSRSSFTQVDRIFEDKVEMANPASDGLPLAAEFAYIPLSAAGKHRIQSCYSGLEKAFRKGAVFDVRNLEDAAAAPKETDESTAGQSAQPAAAPEKSSAVETKVAQEVQVADGANQPCSKTQLLLSAEQLLVEHYPVPGIELYKNFKCSRSEYKPVTDSSPMYSLDCEWCMCEGGKKGLARVAIVDESLTVVYHTFVKPRLKIVDYLTRFSGITKSSLKGVTTTVEDVQKVIGQLLPADAILVGQTVSADLVALKLMHPYIIDTSIIYNLTGHKMRKSKLSLLAETFLGETIQMQVTGHNPVEDSLAAMKLVLLKLNNGLKFGDATASSDRSWLKPTYQQILDQMKREDAQTSAVQENEVTVDPNASLYAKLFTYIESYNTSSLLVTEPAYRKTYEPRVKKLPKTLMKGNNRDDPLAGPVQICTAESLQEATELATSKFMDFKFTLVHADRKDASLETVDGCIASLYASLALKGMLIVVFGGARAGDSFRNGVCMVRVKKPLFSQL